jgi:hypothetical protein
MDERIRMAIEKLEQFKIRLWRDCRPYEHEHDCGCFGGDMDELEEALSALKQSTQSNDALEQLNTPLEKAALVVVDRCSSNCIPSFSRGRNQTVWVNVAGNMCENCGGTGVEPKKNIC